MNKMIYIAAVAALCGACTSSKVITQTFNSVIVMDVEPVIEAFSISSHTDTDSKEASAQKVYSFIYDSEGNLVTEAYLNVDSTATALWELKEISGDEYHMVCVTFAESAQGKPYAIEGKSNVHTLKVHQNIDHYFNHDGSPIGVACEKVVIGKTDTVKVSLFPVSAQVNVIYAVPEILVDVADTLVRFQLNTNTDIAFKEGEPVFTNPEEVIIQVSQGDSKTCVLMPSDSLSYKATYNVDENIVCEFAHDIIQIEKGLHYIATIDWNNKTVAFEESSTVVENPELVE
jgi:hypothetical protein